MYMFIILTFSLEATEQTGILVGNPADYAMDAVQFLGVLLAFIVVCFLAYYSIRLMGRAKNIRGSSNIRIVEAASVGFQHTIQLVKVGEQYFLIGVSRSGVTKIGEVNPESINFDTRPLSEMPFEKYFTKFLGKNKDEANEPNEQNKKDYE